MTLRLAVVPKTTLAGTRLATAADAERLAQLMLDAYHGTIDDAGETLDDARDEIRRTFAGDYGTFDAEASEVIERDGELMAAILVTRFETTPFVSFCLTAPTHQRQGLCRALMIRLINTLHTRGEERLELVVTRESLPAVRLYEQLGFVRSPI